MGDPIETSIERATRRLVEIERSIHDATVLRDHCAEWVDEHQRTIFRLEEERRAIERALEARDAG